MDWFQIEWMGPYPIETAESREEAKQFGIYTIYEKNPKGLKLIYIGETYSQTFGKRLKQHRKDWLYRTENKKVIHFGLVKLVDGKKISQAKVFDIEASLINAHVPPYNTVSKHGYGGRDILVINTGKKGELGTIIGQPKLISLLKKHLK
jgi:hypothetical protein